MENSSPIRQKLSTLYKQKQELNALDDVDIMNLILENQRSNKDLVDKIISGIHSTGSGGEFFKNKDKYLSLEDIESPLFKNIVQDIFKNFNEEIKKERERIFKLLLEKRLLEKGQERIWLEKYEEDLELLEMQFEELLNETSIENYEKDLREKLDKISRDYNLFNFMLKYTQKKIEYISYKITLLEDHDEDGKIKKKAERTIIKLEIIGAKIQKGDFIEGFLEEIGINIENRPDNFILIFYQNDELILKYIEYLNKKFSGLNLVHPIESHIVNINNLNEGIFNDTLVDFINNIFILDGENLDNILKIVENLNQVIAINPDIQNEFIEKIKQKINNQKTFDDLISNPIINQDKFKKIYDFLNYTHIDSINNYLQTKEYKVFMDKLHYLCIWENTSSTKRSSYGTGSGSSQNIARTIFMNIKNTLKKGDIKDLELLFNAKNLGELITFNRDADLEAKISRIYDQLKNIEFIDFSQFLIELGNAITSKNNRGRNHRSDENYGKEFHHLMERYITEIRESYEDLKKLINKGGNNIKTY